MPWVAVNVELCREAKQLVRSECLFCDKRVIFNYRLEAISPGCKKEVPIENSFDMEVHLSDSTGTIHARIQTPDIEEVTTFDPDEILFHSQKGYPVEEMIDKVLGQYPLLCCIAACRRVTPAGAYKEYNILKVYPYQDVFNRIKLPTKEPKMEEIAQNWPSSE